MSNNFKSCMDHHHLEIEEATYQNYSMYRGTVYPGICNSFSSLSFIRTLKKGLYFTRLFIRTFLYTFLYAIFLQRLILLGPLHVILNWIQLYVGDMTLYPPTVLAPPVSQSYSLLGLGHQPFYEKVLYMYKTPNKKVWYTKCSV